MRFWTPGEVERLLDFGCNGLFGASEAMVTLQRDGVAALTSVLARHRIAYLADEVGLGKTMQALGVIACACGDNANARVLVITPRQIVQNGWNTEFQRFSRHVVRDADQVPGLKPGLQVYESLRDWLRGMHSKRGIALLRHPSFMRPVFHTDGNWRDAVRQLDLPDIDTFPEDIRPDRGEERSFAFNLGFAKAVNAWLEREGISFDLVVVDEAQCLRNLERQQTNTVLRALLRGRGRDWLFLSATPAHSGIHNIVTVLNEYADHGGHPPIQAALLEAGDDFRGLQQRLRDFMIRRPRTFLINGQVVRKQQYRKDDVDSLAIPCTEPLGILSIATVQKKLVGILAEARHSNTFRSGYVASFESLEDSLASRQGTAPNRRRTAGDEEHEAAGEGGASDFYQERHHRHDDSRAPDEAFVSEMSRDFRERFRFSLPHPKLDAVELDLALHAFGDRDEGTSGGLKTVVFCRRVSSVRVLRERLVQRYIESIETRCQARWKMDLDWRTGPGNVNAATEVGDERPEDEGLHVEAPVTEDKGNLLRAAQSEGHWLYKFRVTFNDGQRHALFFEINWFRRLCREGGVDAAAAVRRLPPQLWAEARVHATSSGKTHRRRQFRYLVWHALDRAGGQVFGLAPEQVATWRDRLVSVLHGRDRQAAYATESAAPDETLLLFESFWERAAAHGLDLPGSLIGCSDDDVLRYKLVATILGQYLRLTDALVDLYCADVLAKRLGAGHSMMDEFVAWLASDDVDARRLRQVWDDWVRHHGLALATIADTAGMTLEKLAQQEHFGFLNAIEPVVGISGSAGGHKHAIHQFNTPGLPYVMVGTDTIREGVNLHLFCDRVMHFGMPWTAGDLEQRIGRVDRYFGRIERRLRAAGAVAGAVSLDIVYPYLCDTLERQQIEVIMQRKAHAEAVLDAPLGSPDRGGGTIKLDAMPERVSRRNNRAGIQFDTRRHLS